MNPDTARQWEERGKRAFDRGRLDEAAHAFAQAARHYADRGHAVDAARMQGNRAVVLLEMGRVDEALALLEPLPETLTRLQAHHEAALAWGNLALALERAGQRKRAEAAYRRALEGLKAPEERAAVHRGLARLAFRGLRFRDAFTHMVQALLLAPRSPLEAVLARLLDRLFLKLPV